MMRIMLTGAAVAAALLSSANGAQAGSLASIPLASLLLDAGKVTGYLHTPYSRDRMPTVVAPRGYTAMCARTARLCDDDDAKVAEFVSDRSKIGLLRAVNRRVNHSVRAQAEAARGEDQWRRPGPAGAGDCEDYAIEKREQLKASGFPAEDLSYAVVYRRDTGLHTVLVAQIDNERYVLDSLSPWVIRAARAPYTWVKIQSHADPLVWQAVLHAPSAEVGRPSRVLASAQPRIDPMRWGTIRASVRMVDTRFDTLAQSAQVASSPL